MPKSRVGAAISREARVELGKLPGHIRRQMIVAIDALEKNPRPSGSRPLALEREPREVRRLRLGKWRIIYLVVDEQPLILAVRQRPPYDYDDLEALLPPRGM